VGPLTPAALAELARYLRHQAEECLLLAHKERSAPSAAELVVIAASLHERATKLETSLAHHATEQAVAEAR